MHKRLFSLKTPCETCPFRNDKELPFPLNRNRVIAICNDDSFICHNTSKGGNFNGTITDKHRHCAGLAIMLLKMQRPNTIMEIGISRKIFNPSELDMDAPVYKDITEYLDRLDEEQT